MLLRHSRPLPQPFGLRLGQSLRRLLKGLDATEIGPTRHVEPAFPELRLQIGPGPGRLMKLTGGGDQLRRYVAGLGDTLGPDPGPLQLCVESALHGLVPRLQHPPGLLYGALRGLFATASLGSFQALQPELLPAGPHFLLDLRPAPDHPSRLRDRVHHDLLLVSARLSARACRLTHWTVLTSPDPR